MVFKKRKPFERRGLPLRVWAVGAALVATITVLGYRSVQTEQRLNAVASESGTAEDDASSKSLRLKLDSAEDNGAKANLEMRAMAENLQLKLDSAEKEIQKLNEAANEHERQIAMLRQGRSSCEEFFDGWDPKASPPTLVQLFGIAREATAAADCINKGDAATACRHWEGLLVQVEKIGSPLTDSRDEIETLIRQHGCKA